MQSQIMLFFRLLKDCFRDLIPIIAVVLFFQLFILNSVPEGWQNTAIGLMIVGVGLAIFLQGLEIGIFVVGDSLAKEFSKNGSVILLLGFGFLIGYSTTIAEPALNVIANKAALISDGRIDEFWLRQVVALSVGFAISLGIFRILAGHNIAYYIISGYIIVVSVTFFAPKEIIGLAYDLGGVTTSTVTVPLIAALGIGLAASTKGANPLIDGFGLIAFASLTPMVFVQLYGIFVYYFAQTKDIATTIIEQESNTNFSRLEDLIYGFIGTIADVAPILLVILFFHYAVLKRKIHNLRQVLFGFCLVVVGLYAFIVGLELGLFSLGENMAYELTSMKEGFSISNFTISNIVIIYAFAFCIGFATTMAEPALMAIANKANEISNNKIHSLTLRLFVALGVGVGITLGAYRIVQGDGIHYYIIAGYMVVIALTLITPRNIIPIAYDSGGVTTSTVTVPLVAALGVGLANNIDGRSPLIDGFGLIAFASLFPIISVMIYGIIAHYLLKRSHSKTS